MESIKEASHYEKMEILTRAWAFLNKIYFDNNLNPINITYGNLNKPYRKMDAYGIFRPESITFTPDKNLTIMPGIEIDHRVFEDPWECADYDEDRAYAILMVMLHEMIHQYCFENGIDDGDHNDNFTKAADEHGLVSEYANGQQVREYIKDPTLFLEFMEEMDDLYGAA